MAKNNSNFANICKKQTLNEQIFKYLNISTKCFPPPTEMSLIRIMLACFQQSTRFLGCFGKLAKTISDDPDKSWRSCSFLSEVMRERERSSVTVIGCRLLHQRDDAWILDLSVEVTRHICSDSGIRPSACLRRHRLGKHLISAEAILVFVLSSCLKQQSIH